MVQKTFTPAGTHKVIFERVYPGQSIRSEHRHETSQLLYADIGIMLLTVPDGVFLLPPRQGAWIPAGTPHSIAFLTETRMRTFYYEPAYAQAALGSRAADGFKILAINSFIDTLIRQLFLMKNRESASFELSRRLLLALISEGSPLQSRCSLPQRRELHAVCEEVIAARLWSMPLASAAAKAKLSPKTFSRRFAASAHMTWRSWLAGMRLIVSLEDLARGAAVKEAAIRAGYADAAAYCAAFRKFFGMTPALLRERQSRSAADGLRTHEGPRFPQDAEALESCPRRLPPA